MAFILPTAVASGQISVSRRRRTYEFLQNTSPALPPTQTSSNSTSQPVAPTITHTTRDLTAAREAAIQAVAKRLAEREAANAQAARKRAEEWQQLMNELRTPSTMPSKQYAVSAPPAPPKPAPMPAPLIEKPAPSDTKPQPEPIPPRSVKSVSVGAPSKDTEQSKVERSSTYESSEPVRTAMDAAEKAVQSMANILGELGDKPEEEVDAVVENALRDIAKEAGVVEDVVAETLETLKDEVKGVKAKDAAKDVESVQNADKSVVQRVEYVIKDENNVNSKGEVENVVVERDGVTSKAVSAGGQTSSSGTSKKTLGEKILDAISEGLPSAEVSEEPSEVAVDKAEVIRLVESGDIKKLTVTKLRRLLSANGLKTSGRKSELIARLTSYAKTK